MYLPQHLRADAAQTEELLTGIRAADLVSVTAEGIVSTFLPLIFTGATLAGHLARASDHGHVETRGESMVIVHGPDGYITPSWYATKAETGRVVPTWNYLLAHVYGDLVIHDDPVWLERHVRALTDRHEADRAAPWGVDDAPPDFTAAQLRAIVGVELVITRVEAKAKLGTHRTAADVQGVIDGLAQRGDTALAAATARGRPRL